jgi:hypothetical protein
MTRRIGIVLEREEELPAANEWKDVYEAFNAMFGEHESYALFHRLRTAIEAPRPHAAERAEKLRGLLEGPLPPAERVALLIDGLLGGFQARREALADCVSAEEVRALLSLGSRQAVQARREAGQLLAVKERDELKFPIWQFDATTDTGVLRGFPEILAALKERDSIWTLLWMRTPQRALDNATPAEALRAGRTQQTVEVARAAVAD